MFRHFHIFLFFVLTTHIAAAQSATQHYNEGIKLQDQEKYSQALVSFKKAIAINPNYKEALYSAGWCSIELKKYNEALPYLQKAKILWPKEAKVFLEIGYASEMLGKKNDAIDNYNKCLSLNPGYALAYQYLSSLYFDEQEYKKALENFDSYIIYEPDVTNYEIYYKKGYCENELGKYNEAIVSLNRANELNANDAKTYNELGYAYTKLKNADDAIKNFNKSLEINGKSFYATNGLGDVYKDLKKNVAEALKYYLRAVDIEPGNKKSNYWAGWCYNDMGKNNDAVPFLKKAIEADGKYVNAITELGYSDYALQNYDDALAQFKKAIAIEKTDLSVYYSGLCYVGMKQKNDALKMYNDLKEMNSDYADKLKKKIDDM